MNFEQLSYLISKDYPIKKHAVKLNRVFFL